MARWLVLVLAGAIAFAAAPVRAEMSADRALLAIEQPDRAFAQIEALPQRIAAGGRESGRRPDDSTTAKAMSRAADEAFEAPTLRRAIEDGLAGLPGPTSGDALPAVARRWEEAGTQLETMLAEQGEEAVARKLAADLERHADKAKIEALSAVMAAPAVAGEIAVAAKRFERALELGGAGARERLQVADASTRAALVEALMAEGRKPAEEAGGAAPVEAGRRATMAYLQARLALLPSADLAMLEAFYADPAGRAKRDMLVVAFTNVTDAASRRTLQLYVEALRETAR